METNLVHRVFESNRNKCVDINCSGSLKRSARATDNCKGSTCVVYDNVSGPEIGISYRKHCDKCDCVYFYGFYITSQKNKVYEPISTLQFYQESECTFFHVNMFEEHRMWRFQNGAAPELFCSVYNSRHRSSFESLCKILGERNVGRRTTSDLRLVSKRFTTAFNFFEIQLLVEENLSQTFVVSSAANIKSKKKF